MPELCAMTGKVCHPGPRAAKAAARGLHHAARAYFCFSCRAWHVAKRERRTR